MQTITQPAVLPAAEFHGTLKLLLLHDERDRERIWIVLSGESAETWYGKPLHNFCRCPVLEWPKFAWQELERVDISAKDLLLATAKQLNS